MATEQLTQNTELVIGLVGAVGTDLGGVTHHLKQQLERAGYDVAELKISRRVISEFAEYHCPTESGFARYDCLIKAGNDIRERASVEQSSKIGNGVLAQGAAAIIYAEREKTTTPEGLVSSRPNFRKAYIIDSLKRPEEVELLRKVYPEGFVLVGAYQDEAERLDRLCGPQRNVMSSEEANRLIERDADEEKEPHGQRVRKTFHLSDFFLHVTSDRPRLECDVRRMVELWFGNPQLTPTFDEYAMYMAFAASLRSADLSRQVGAVIAKDNEILSSGANDCPCAFGGLYWPKRSESGCIEDVEGGRDHTLGIDSNREQQLIMIQEIVEKLKREYHELDEQKVSALIGTTSIADLTEYGRVVRAEMEALLACARNNISMRKGELFSTTFPCHNCAKHIVSAGIKRVVYIEPYAKSKALGFHVDSIKAIEPGATSDEKVVFEPFVGIGPRKFFDLFSMSHGSNYELTRKDRQTGKKRAWSIEKAQVRLQMNPNSYLDLEVLASGSFDAFKSNSSTESSNGE